MRSPFAHAIETHYHGCRFRSRTEARWAVFFDALGIVWQYEREGYKLPAGRYLPDFWLADKGGRPPSWVEIKGAKPDRRARILVQQLACATHLDAYLVYGQPLEHVVYYITAAGGCGARWQGTHEYPAKIILAGLDARYGDGHAASNSTRLMVAVNAASGARFEFGENGAPNK